MVMEIWCLRSGNGGDSVAVRGGELTTLGTKGKGLRKKRVADNIVEEAIVGDNFGVAKENVPKANVGLEIIIVSDDDGDDDNEVVGDTMDTVVAENDDEIDSAAVGMSGFILEACVDAMEGGGLEGGGDRFNLPTTPPALPAAAIPLSVVFPLPYRFLRH
ncbi:hypothetical protein Tco_0438725 [Tanacetum coccineum]